MLSQIQYANYSIECIMFYLGNLFIVVSMLNKLLTTYKIELLDQSQSFFQSYGYDSLCSFTYSDIY